MKPLMKKLLLVSALLLPATALAASYVPLEPLPGLTGNLNFAGYLAVAFRTAMWAGAALAVLMLTVGGVQYMTSDALGQKEAGRERIKNAVLGFLLLLSVYVILYTINPNLLTFNLITGQYGKPVPSPASQGQEAGSAAGRITGEQIDPQTGATRFITETDEQGREVRYPLPASSPTNGYYYIDSGSQVHVFQSVEGCVTSRSRIMTGNPTCRSY